MNMYFGFLGTYPQTFGTFAQKASRVTSRNVTVKSHHTIKSLLHIHLFNIWELDSGLMRDRCLRH
jgi:hypothetical protein